MYGPTLIQPIPFPGKRGARRGAAQAESRMRGGELEMMTRLIARDIRMLYAEIYAIDHEEHCIEAGAELVDMLGATANQRYSAGFGNQESALKVQLTGSRLGERLSDLKAERQKLVAAMNRLLARPGDMTIGEVAALPATVLPVGSWSESALAGSAEILVKRAAVTVAEERLNVARIEQWPDLSGRVGVAFRGSGDPLFTVGLGIELPLFNGQSRKPLVRAAEQELEAARQDLKDSEAQVRGEVARITADVERARAQIIRFEQALIPQSSLALDAARSTYLSGSGDFSTVIEDFNMWLDARAELARREADQYKAWAELDALFHSPGGPSSASN
jgi:outer membrane protein, heavy metal efflux system